MSEWSCAHHYNRAQKALFLFTRIDCVHTRRSFHLKLRFARTNIVRMLINVSLKLILFLSSLASYGWQLPKISNKSHSHSRVHIIFVWVLLKVGCVREFVVFSRCFKNKKSHGRVLHSYTKTEENIIIIQTALSHWQEKVETTMSTRTLIH